ncbi:probable helicase senataxin isoform X2 [Cephus cinctus]|uniref:Probable helicase senataxin isoform X2 n=1 Tax=Cephus cinctus TaxID=211228 RepID=A0AAJ7W0Y7_CEPCN|nr:probable helicase senataxin isoform X2 [Cephus cinctus]
MESHETGVEFILERVNGSDTIVLDEHVQTYTCGRGKRNQIVCLSLWVSREHCLFIRNQNTLNVVDLSSSNGVFVNGERIPAKQMMTLKEDDIIGIGSPTIDPTDITMFVYVLRVSRPKLSSMENSSDTLTRTVLNTNNSSVLNSDDVASEKKQRRRSFLENSSLYLPRKIAKMNSSELCGDAIQRVLDESEIDVKIEIRPITPVLLSSTKEENNIDVHLSIHSLTNSIHEPNNDNQKENLPTPILMECEEKNISMTTELSNGMKDCIDVNTSLENLSNFSAPEIKEIPQTIHSPLTKNNYPTKYCFNIDKKKLISNKTLCKNETEPTKVKDITNSNLINIQKNSSTINKRSSNGGCISMQKSTTASEHNDSFENDIIVLDDTEDEELHTNKSSHNVTTTTNVQAIYNNGPCSSKNSSSTLGKSIKASNIHSSTIASNNLLRDNQMEILPNEKSTIAEPSASSNGITNIEVTPIKMEIEFQRLNNDYHTPVTSPSKNSPEIFVTSPIKVRQLKHEQTTTFSMSDVVNLTDDEEDIFPSSQLFDTTTDVQLPIKEEVKGEVDELFQTPYDTDSIILLSDSEDEDNPWLQRLSRSQVLLEVDEPALKPAETKKRLSDLQITEILDSKDQEGQPKKKTHNDENKKNKINKAKHKSHSKKHRKKDAMEVDAAVPDDIVPPETSENKNLDHKKHRTHEKRLSDKLIRKEVRAGESPQSSNKDKSSGCKDTHPQDDLCYDNILTIGTKTNLSTTEKLKSTPLKLSSLDKKPPEIIAPPNLPKGEGKGFSCNVQRSTTSSSVTVAATTSTVAENTLNTTEINTVAKTTSQVKLSTKEKKELLIQKKLEKANYMKEQKHRRDKYKWADCLPVSNNKKSLSLSKAEKLEIINDRKAKLKKLADEKKADAKDSKPKRHIINKPKAKISQKTRGDFLIQPQDADRESRGTDITSSCPTNIASESSTSTDKRTSSTVEETHVEKNLPAKLASEKSLRKDSDNPSRSSVPGDIANVALNLRDSLTLSKCPTTDIKKAHKQKVSHESSPSATTSTKSISITDRTKNLADTRNRKTKDCSETIQKENCSPNAKSSTVKNKNKKSVHFSTELVQVKYYEIESFNTLNKVVGKDAPIPQKKLAVKTNNNATQPCPKLEEFLLQIFMWNPVWLEEQKRFKIDPPVTGTKELIPLLTSYKSFDEYYRIIMPLLLLEIWHGITKEFEVIDKNPKRPTVICSIVSNSASSYQIPSSKLSLTNMMLEVLATKEDIHKQAHPIYGDLVFFELGYTDKGKHRFHKVFAYVTNVYQTVLTPQTYYNRDLVNYVKNPYALLTYTVMTKPLEVNVHANRAQRLRSITYLRSDIRMIQALQYLPSSPLLSAILKPKANDMSHSTVLSKLKNYPLVTKEKLNHKQLEAVIKVTDAIVQKEAKICLIQGPPGTGKSKVIVNIITQVLYGDNRYKNNRAPLRILVCAPSNAAIDEIVLRLLTVRAKFKQDRFKMVRVGRIETMHPTVKEISVPELARRDIKKIASTYSSSAYSMDSVEEESSTCKGSRIHKGHLCNTIS